PSAPPFFENVSPTPIRRSSRSRRRWSAPCPEPTGDPDVPPPLRDHDPVTDCSVGHRRERKNSSSGAAHSTSSTPPRTSGRWTRRRSRTTSHRDPQAPVRGSQAPKTRWPTRAATAAPAHMVHGSSVTTSVQSSSRQPSPRELAAARSASTSAWANGPPSASRRLVAAASSRPSGLRTRAPTRTSPAGVRAATSRAPRTSASAAARTALTGASRTGQVAIELVGEAHALGNRLQLLVGVEVGLGPDDLEHPGRQPQVLEDAHVALAPRVGVLELLVGQVGGLHVELVEHVSGEVVVQGGGGVGEHEPHPGRPGPQDHKELVV